MIDAGRRSRSLGRTAGDLAGFSQVWPTEYAPFLFEVTLSYRTQGSREPPYSGLAAPFDSVPKPASTWLGYWGGHVVGSLEKQVKTVQLN